MPPVLFFGKKVNTHTCRIFETEDGKNNNPQIKTQRSQ
jgi:hypothetical protein